MPGGGERLQPLNEFLKQHQAVQEEQRKVAKLEAALAEQKNASDKTIAHLQEQIDTLSDGLQKVSRRVDLNGVDPQLAAVAE